MKKYTSSVLLFMILIFSSCQSTKINSKAKKEFSVFASPQGSSAITQYIFTNNKNDDFNPCKKIIHDFSYIGNKEERLFFARQVKNSRYTPLCVSKAKISPEKEHVEDIFTGTVYDINWDQSDEVAYYNYTYELGYAFSSEICENKLITTFTYYTYPDKHVVERIESENTKSGTYIIKKSTIYVFSKMNLNFRNATREDLVKMILNNECPPDYNYYTGNSKTASFVRIKTTIKDINTEEVYTLIKSNQEYEIETYVYFRSESFG